MRILFVIFLSLISIFLPLKSFSSQPIGVLEINGAIDPASEDYIIRGLKKAEKQHYQLIVLQLNSSNGLETAMRGINQAINASHIPVITYVSPMGAQATLEGIFILYASHIAAMAPDTHLGSIPSTQLHQGSIAKKELADATSYIRNLAELRQRNANWGIAAITQGANISAEEALKLNVINLIAKDIPDLLQQLNGHVIPMGYSSYTIDTNDFNLISIKPDWRTQTLKILTNPNIAYILLLIGIYGLFFELSNPGLILPGAIGVISLLLTLYAFQLLPVSYIGLSILLIGITFMVFEVFVSSFGILGIAGLAAFITGSILLYDTSITGYHIAWSIIMTMTLLTIGFFGLIVWLVAFSSRKPVITGHEGLLEQEGQVVAIHDKHISVRVLGETWDAICDEPIRIGQTIRVKRVKNLELTVQPISKKLENK